MEIQSEYDGFASTINFFIDLINISENLKFSNDKLAMLKNELKKIN